MPSINAVVDLAIEAPVAVLTIDNAPVNALSAAVRQGLAEGARQAQADPAVRAIVVICAGRTFFAGADITEFGKPPVEPRLADLLNGIEALTKPVVAAIHGTALGGGLETAMACSYRVAVPSARLGLPEVKLGLLPGAGGTQRLPRIVGVEAALEMIAIGDPITADAALANGLVDALAPEGALRETAIAFAHRLAAEGAAARRVCDLGERLAAARGHPEIFDAFLKANARKFRGLEAPVACVEAVRAAVELPFEAGLQRERELFTRLLGGVQSKAQRHLFFAERQAARIADIPEDTKTHPIGKVGIVGAGVMGGGIAMNFLNVGLPVTLVEAKAEALERGIATIGANYENTARKGRLTADDVQRRMGLLSGALDLAALADCDLVIEAVFEDMAVKKAVFSKLDELAKPGAILASNTSYLDIDEIAAATSRPEQVLGLHFFSPANVMKLLEVVRGAKTSKPVIATAMKLGKRIGKVAALVGVCHGFVGNRMLAQRQQQAQALILEGATPWDVDRVLCDFGFPMGPFAMSDLAGLDIGWTREASSSSTVREVLNEMDRRGQKTRAGFYDYDDNRRATPSPVTEQVILEFAKKHGTARRAISDQEILERCLYPMVNEGAKILAEGIAQRASDIDIVWINGYGWPVYRGGPMFWADTVGASTILQALKGYQERFGETFQPAPLLEEMAAQGRRFTAT